MNELELLEREDDNIIYPLQIKNRVERQAARDCTESEADNNRPARRFCKIHLDSEDVWIVGRVWRQGIYEIARFTDEPDGKEVAKARAYRFIACEEAVADEREAQSVAQLQTINDEIRQEYATQAADDLGEFEEYIAFAM